MLNRLPVEINPFRYVEQRRELSGIMPLREMSRLVEMALDSSGDFQVELVFSLSETHLPMVKGSVQGQIQVECQRCLQPMTLTINHPIEVVFTRSETDRRPEEAGYESWVVEDDSLYLRDFVEDELLLAMPLIPRHDSCQPLKPLIEGYEDDAVNNESDPTEEKKNPFAVLKNWKKSE
ncbi:YceD family protein [Thiofilum flexile]|uniref:YceD family protein n=1 Tax=Thiofilum flexile TaxID=125627 RepID=UPI00035D049B|nr:YceD family protein [Thiofilum flexile]